MSALVEMLYPVPDVRRTPLSLLGWWESRRLLYNQVVGTAGLFTLAVGYAIGPWETPLDLLIGAAIYGVMANVCYSMGWALEVMAGFVWGRQAPRVGPLLFRQGVIFSVILTLLPVVAMVFVRTVMLVAGLVELVIG